MSNLKIKMIYPIFLPDMGGLQLQIYHIARGLVKKGYHVEVHCANIYKNRMNLLPESEFIEGILVKRYSMIGGLFKKLYITTSYFFNELLTDENYDIIHVFSFLPYFMTNVSVILSKLMGRRIVITPTFHPYRLNSYNDIFGKINGLVYDRFLGIMILKFANHIIALTEEEARYYKSLGIDKVSVIPVGVDIDRHKVSDSDVSKFVSRYKIDAASPKILFVGRLDKRKGVDFLLKSLKILKENYLNDFLMIFVGCNPIEDYRYAKIIKKYSLEKNILGLGVVSDKELACAYEISDVVVVPSVFEAFSHVVVEAWAHKKPVIATKNVALSTKVKKIKGGTVVSFGDSIKLAEEIYALITDRNLAKQMGNNGYRLVMREFVWDKIVNEVERIYMEVLKV